MTTNERLEQLRQVLYDGGLEGIMNLIGDGPIDEITEDYLRGHVKAWDVFVYLTRWGKTPIATPLGQPVTTPTVMAALMASLGFAMGPKAREIVSKDLADRVTRLNRAFNIERGFITDRVIPTVDCKQIVVRYILPRDVDQVEIHVASTFGDIDEIVTRPGGTEIIKKNDESALAYRTYQVPTINSLVLRSYQHVGIGWATLHYPGINIENITDWNGDEPW